MTITCYHSRLYINLDSTLIPSEQLILLVHLSYVPAWRAWGSGTQPRQNVDDARDIKTGDISDDILYVTSSPFNLEFQIFSVFGFSIRVSFDNSTSFFN